MTYAPWWYITLWDKSSVTWIKFISKIGVSHPKVPFRDLRHFRHKASVTIVNAEASAYSAVWLMSAFVNELAPPHVRSQQAQCVQQCRRIMEKTLYPSPLITQENSYSISHLLATVTTQWLDGDSVVTVHICKQHSDYTAIGSSVTMLLAVVNGDYTVTVQSLCSHRG